MILPSGEINWNCPCLGGMATGPCGVPFRDAFSCFHHSRAEPKGSDCVDQFRGMHECMMKYPELYKDYSKDDEDDDVDDNDIDDKNPDNINKTSDNIDGASAENKTSSHVKQNGS